MSILNSVLVLGALGLIFGAILAYASKKFAVDVDERLESILDVLPGANCGGVWISRLWRSCKCDS